MARAPDTRPRSSTNTRGVARDGWQPDAWPICPELADTPLSELVPGFDTIADLDVPYARLPRRLGLYAERFGRWSDLAGESPTSLLELPKVAHAAVRALLEAAHDLARITEKVTHAEPVGAPAAAARFATALRDQDRIILARRVWTLHPESTAAVAERLGVVPHSILRNQPRALARMIEALREPAHRELSEHARTLRAAIGTCAPINALTSALAELGIEPGSEAADLLLHLAGPYAVRADWLETVDGKGGISDVCGELATEYEDQVMSHARVLELLTSRGVRADFADAFIRDHTPLRRFGDLWVQWPDAGVARKAEAMLRVLGAPATLEELTSALREANATEISSLSRVVSDDDRFVRTSRHRWGLRAWGLDEYHGLAAAIGQHIDDAGGSASVAAITADILDRFPDVAEASIVSYLGTLAFVVDQGIARRRREHDPWPPLPDLNSVRGCFLNGPNEIRLAIRVDHHLLRGSGRPIPAAVAMAAGVGPGERLTFAGEHASLDVYWDLTSIRGSHVGSLRVQAAAANASRGDRLILVLRPDDHRYEVHVIPRYAPPEAQMRMLLGHPPGANPIVDLARSLECDPEDVADILCRRGDDALLDIVHTVSLARSSVRNPGHTVDSCRTEGQSDDRPDDEPSLRL